MVREVYKGYERPLVRVVHGLPISWEPVVATLYDPYIRSAVWSPCNRFIAVAKDAEVELRDATTLALLNTFERPRLRPPCRSPSLTFSPDSRLLARVDSEQSAPTTSTTRCTSWDLKAGGSVEVDINLPAGSAIKSDFVPVYSKDGTMLAVVSSDIHNKAEIITFDLSAKRAHIYPLSEERIIPPIWTRDEFLRFATVEPGHITIWETDFTFTHSSKVVVKPLPTPDKNSHRVSIRFLFLPTHSQLAISIRRTLLIWDARDSKLLTKISGAEPSHMSFSSDGLFFACVHGNNEEVCVWKRSLSGYILHQRLAFDPFPLQLTLSPDGASGIIRLDFTIRLWHTKDPILSSLPTVARSGFVLEFSPCETLVAFARQFDNTVTVLHIQSGDPQLTIDTGMRVQYLGVTRSTIVVADKERVVTWNVVAGDRAGINDSVQTATFDLSQPYSGVNSLSISPDLSRVVTLRIMDQALRRIEIYDVSTGRCLTGVIFDTIREGMLKSPSFPMDSRSLTQAEDSFPERMWFTPDGRDIWSGSYLHGWEIIGDNESGTMGLQPLRRTTPLPGIFPWESSLGYKVTGDGWILSPTQKRLAWLPHEWRSYEQGITWSGRFLGLGGEGLREAVILEFFRSTD